MDCARRTEEGGAKGGIVVGGFREHGRGCGELPWFALVTEVEDITVDFIADFAGQDGERACDVDTLAF